MQIHIFEIDFTKNFFFLFLLTVILRSFLLLRIFEYGFWNKKCALTCQETLFWMVQRYEEKWAQKSSFWVKKAKVGFSMIEKLLWSGWPLNMKCSFFKVNTIKWLAIFDILIDWLTRAAFLYIMKTKMTIFSSFLHWFCSKLVKSCILAFHTIVFKQAKL
jgi:hypothetical protein